MVSWRVITKASVFIGCYLALIILPMALHSDVYKVINNDTLSHIQSFYRYADGDYSGVFYGGNVIIGVILNGIESVFGIEIPISFMIFNFGALILAGLICGYMVYVLSKNVIGSLLTIPFIIFGVNSTMQLFYCGTIFNLSGVLIFVPLMIIIGKWIFSDKKYKLIPLEVALLALAIYWHPSLGSGLSLLQGIGRINISPFEMYLLMFGLVNTMLLLVSIFVILKSKIKLSKYTLVVIVGLLIVSLTMLGLSCLGSYVTARLIINMGLFMGLLTSIIFGIAYDCSSKKVRGWFIFGVIFCFGSGLINWVVNVIIRGIPANAILS
jgi:hypothetical protein